MYLVQCSERDGPQNEASGLRVHRLVDGGAKGEQS